MPTKVPSRKKKTGVIGTTTNGSAGNFTDSAMDEFLAKIGLYRKPIAKDGSCLFRAVSEQVHSSQARHLDVRNQCIAFMRQNRELFEEFVEGPFDHHLYKLQNPKEWAGQVEITALSQMYRKDFVVYQDINSSPTKVTDHGYQDKILLCYSNGNHYDIIYDNKFREHAAMCQSLLYEALYNKVFTELDKKENAKKGKQRGAGSIENGRNNQKSILELVNGCMTDETDTVENTGDNEGWTEVKSKARAKHDRQAKPVEIDENKEPEEIKGKVNNDQKNLWELRRSVDPHLYRNISLEVWEEDKNLRQQQDLAVAVSLQFKSGDRCLVKLGPPNAPVDKNYSAIIKEDYSGSESVLVYIPELKEKQVVPVQCIKPSENQQGHNYKELTGYYKKEEASNGSVPEDGPKDDNKNKKKRPPRSRRGPGKGGDDSGNVSEDAPRGRGRQRERYGNRRRFPKDDRNNKDEEEAKFIAEQIKLVELQEKDPKAFPALPVRSATQASPTALAVSPPQPADVEEKVKDPRPPPQVEEKTKENDKTPASIDSTPAAFWSRLKTKPTTEMVNQSQSPATSPTSRKPESQLQQPLGTLPNKSDEKSDKQEQHEAIETKVVEIEAVQEKAAPIDNTESTIYNAKQTNASEIESKQYQTAQLKPLLSDVKHSKTSGQVFEVKVPQPAKLMQQVKISPPSKLTQRPKTPPKPSETQETTTKQIPSTVVESHDKITVQGFTAPVTKNEMIEDEKVIGSNLKENQETNPVQKVEEQPLETPPSADKPLNNKERFSQIEENNTKEEEPMKIDSMKVADGVSGANSDKKTVTFAKDHQEIPAVPYGQSQKGILIMNGTNRPQQAGEQGYKSTNPEEYPAVAKQEAKQDSSTIPQEHKEKDPQSFPSTIANEGLQSSSPTAQQQNQALMQFMPMPPIPPGVQMPTGLSTDPNGADLPQDIATLRYFFNLGYQQYLVMASQMNSPQLPYLFMYQGAAMQEPMIQPNQQPVASLSQQQIYHNMQHQQLTYQHAGMQNYQVPFHMPQTSQDSTSQHDRTSERTNPTQHQPQLQPQQQIQMPHQQQSGHFQTQQQPQYGQGYRPPNKNWHYNSNKAHVGHFGSIPQQRIPYNQNSGMPRQTHYKESKPNRKQQGMKNRNAESFSTHFSTHPHGQNMAHNQAASGQPTSYYMPNDLTKGSSAEFYQGMLGTVNFPPHMQQGMPPHSTVSSRMYTN